jgi:hypothetical protein
MREKRVRYNANCLSTYLDVPGEVKMFATVRKPAVAGYSSAACAAANRAMGIRKGLQLT